MLAKNFKDEASPIIREYLIYLQTIKGKSPKTIEEYFLDLRTFFRFLKTVRGLVPKDTPFDEIPISDVTLDLIKTVTLSDGYEFMAFLIDDRQNNSSTRLRKTSALRGFFNYLCVKKHYIDDDPLKELETPKQKKSLPNILRLNKVFSCLRQSTAHTRSETTVLLQSFLIVV